MDFHENRILLLPDAEIVENADNDYFLLDQAKQRYFRINKETAFVLTLMREKPLTTKQLIKELENKFSINNQGIEKKLNIFITQLVQKGVLKFEGVENFQNEMVESIIFKRPILKCRLKITFSFLSRNINQNFLGKTKNQLIFFFVIYVTIAVILGKFTLNNIYQSNKISMIAPIFYILPIVILQIIGHELAHIYMCKKMGGEVKEVGLGLLYYFIPVAFVTYKNAYRLSKLSRAKMSIAGPLFDLSVFILVCLLLLFTSDLENILFPLFFLQMSIQLFNFNLLLPSDLYRFIESLSGQYNVRRKGFKFVLSTVTRNRRHANTKPLSKKIQTFYFVYSILAIAYVCFLFIGFLSLFQFLIEE